jgi:hypothetical protein
MSTDALTAKNVMGELTMLDVYSYIEDKAHSANVYFNSPLLSCWHATSEMHGLVFCRSHIILREETWFNGSGKILVIQKTAKAKAADDRIFTADINGLNLSIGFYNKYSGLCEIPFSLKTCEKFRNGV